MKRFYLQRRRDDISRLSDGKEKRRALARIARDALGIRIADIEVAHKDADDLLRRRGRKPRLNPPALRRPDLLHRSRRTRRTEDDLVFRRTDESCGEQQADKYHAHHFDLLASKMRLLPMTETTISPAP